MRDGDQGQSQQDYCRWLHAGSAVSEVVGGKRTPTRTQIWSEHQAPPPPFQCLKLVPRVAGKEPVIRETSFSHFEISSSTQQLKAVSKQRCYLPDLVN